MFVGNVQNIRVMGVFYEHTYVILYNQNSYAFQPTKTARNYKKS